MTIRIYPSTLDGSPLETHETSQPITIHNWLADKVRGYADHVGDQHPIVIEVDGEVVPPSDWEETIITPESEVRIYPDPKGMLLVAVLVAAVIGFILGAFLKPDKPKAQQEGKSLTSADIKANQPRYGEPIPEIAGSPWVYPDYLLPPRKLYTGYREQWTYAFFAIGKGNMQKSLANLRIGDTPVALLGDNAEVRFYEPGQIVFEQTQTTRLLLPDASWYAGDGYYCDIDGTGFQKLPNTGITFYPWRAVVDLGNGVAVIGGTEYGYNGTATRPAFFRTQDGGQSYIGGPAYSPGWDWLWSGEPNIQTMVYDPVHKAIIAAGVGGRITRSTDGGLTWSPFVIPPGWTSSPSNPRYIFKSIYHGGSGAIILFGTEYRYTRSTDGGVTWSGWKAFSGWEHPYGGAYSGVTGVIEHPETGTLITISNTGDSSWGGIDGISRSFDGGLTWERLRPIDDSDELNSYIEASDPVRCPVTGNLLFFSDDGYMAYTDDVGETFNFVYPFSGISGLYDTRGAAPYVIPGGVRVLCNARAAPLLPASYLLLMATSIDGGQTWSAQVLDGPREEPFPVWYHAYTLPNLLPSPAEWWHPCEEVGFTNFGNSGFVLGAIDQVATFWTQGVTFLGDSITSASVPLPGSWTAGMKVIVNVADTVVFHGADTLESAYLDAFDLYPGDSIQITAIGGVNQGTYEIDSITGAGHYKLVGAGFAVGTEVCYIRPAGLVFTIQSVAANGIEVNPDAYTPWTDFPSSGLVGSASNVSLDPASASVGWAGPFVAVPGEEQAEAFEVDVFFPQGLIQYNDSGDPRDRTAITVIQWRYVGAAGWNEIVLSRTLSTPDQIGFTQRVNLPTPGRVEVRMRAGAAASSSTQIREQQQWTALRSKIIGAPLVYPGMTTMSVKLRSGDKISGNVENKIKIRPTRILPTVENIAVSEPTRDIVPFLLYMFQSVGYGRELVDMERLAAYHSVWEAEDDHFDLAITTSSTLKVIANYALNAGFAELTLRNGTISAVRDVAVAGDLPTRVYSPQQYSAPLVESTECLVTDDIDGVDAEYQDYWDGATRTVSFRLPGDAGKRTETIKTPGVTSASKALRLAERRRRILAFRRTEYTGATEMHMLNSEYLDLVGLQDGIPEYGQSSRILSYDGTTVRIAEPIIQYDEPMVACMIRMDGTSTEPVAITGFPDHYTMELASLPFEPHLGGDGRDPTVILFGRLDMWCHLARITSIQPLEDGRVRFKAVNYDPRQYILTN